MDVVEDDVDHVLDVALGRLQLTARSGERPRRTVGGLHLGRSKAGCDERRDQQEAERSYSSPLHGALPSIDAQEFYNLLGEDGCRSVDEAVTVWRSRAARTSARALAPTPHAPCLRRPGAAGRARRRPRGAPGNAAGSGPGPR